jgi:anti-anti-sigma regulatory factor
MIVQLPPMCGMQTHPNLMKKVDKAIKDKDFPVDLDCTNTSFTTTMFCRFIIQVNKKVIKAGGKVRLLNMDDIMFEGMKAIGLLETIEATRKIKKGKVRHGSTR